MGSGRALLPLRLPGFPRLLAAYTLNELGDAVAQVALAILVFRETGSPLAAAALFVAMRFVPALLAPALTARLDTAPLRRALPGLYVAEGVAFAVLALTAEAFLLPLVLLLVTLDGTLALCGRALTRTAAATTLEPAGALREGNALLNMGFALSSVLGAALGGALVAGVGVAAALALDSASFLAVAVLLATSPSLRGCRAGEAEAEAGGWGERLRTGLAYARRRPIVRRLLAAQGAALVFFYLVVPVEVVYVERSLDAGAGGLGALLAAWGAGIVLGSLLFARLRSRSLTGVLVAATAVIGLAYLGLAAAPTLAAACAVSVVGGTGNGMQWVAAVTTLQEAVEDAFQARVLVLLESIAAAAPGVGFLLGGLITALLTPRLAYLAAGAGVLVVLALAALAALRGRRGDAGPLHPGPVPEPA